ncbi:porin [Paraburkholderia pallida]|uniref:Porin n=1 Tax=Paraburkholderia pallida TaxID=2547399 RepID=A0A4P7CX68_9BURK|nr:porin [Paraburkholderia pallida]QBQ98869.1 porin [Paraburkholderia pallida]
MKRVCSGLACLMASAGMAHAQSVTLAGDITTGIAYVSNEGTNYNWNPYAANPGLGHAYRFLDNNSTGSRFVLTGTEPLGGGTAATFKLADGFKPSNGAFAPGAGGRLFGVQATVGLKSDTLGQVTLGRQYDPMQYLVAIYASDNDWAGTIGGHIGDSDNFDGSFRVNNSIEYMSPVWAGLQFGGLYGFSNSAGGFADNRIWSTALSYTNGPLGLAVGYMRLDTPDSMTNQTGAIGALNGVPSTDDYSNAFTTNPFGAGVAKQQIIGAGGAYSFGKATLGATFSDVQFNYLDATKLELRNYELNFKYAITPVMTVGTAYILTTGDFDAKPGTPGKTPRWNQINLGMDYSLSKRTMLYLVGAYQRANGDARYASLQPSLLPLSSSREQAVITAGIDHRF